MKLDDFWKWASAIIVLIASIFATTQAPRIVFTEGFDINLVINLTFDDEADPWDDYSTVDHNFTSTDAEWANRTLCKWNGCLALLEEENDMISAPTKFNYSSFAISMWVYFEDNHGASNSGSIYQSGTNGAGTLKWCEYSTYGYSAGWTGEGGTAGGNQGGDDVNTQQWHHYFAQYNNETELFQMYIDNTLEVSETETGVGNLNHTIGETFQIGLGQFGIELNGYIDEVLAWDRGNFTAAEIQSIYDSRRLGTPPDGDLYIKNITYTLPWNWSSTYNELSGTDMDINVTFSNYGVTNNSGSVNYVIKVKNLSDGVTYNLCSGSTSINAGTDVSIVCTWNATSGYHVGWAAIDTADSFDEDALYGSETNNNYTGIWIPWVNRPHLAFNRSDWENDLEPYCDNNSNKVADSSCDWYSAFTSEDFNEGWGAVDVDPRAKKGRESAIRCVYNDWNTSNTGCVRARNHLFGWHNRTGYSSTTVQALHEVIHIAYILDWMWPTLNETDFNTLAPQVHTLCQDITNHVDVRPDLDGTTPTGGNGQGFGLGMMGYCLGTIGVYQNNPTFRQELNDEYATNSIIDEWMVRESNFLNAYKNDTEAVYQEKMLYLWYSHYHPVENWFFESRFNITEVSDDYQNAICAMATQVAYTILDHQYNGDTLRNDEDNEFRQISMGDTNSYEKIGSDGLSGWEVVTMFGAMCEDTDAKQVAAYLRDLAYDQDDQTRSVQGMYIYYWLKNAVSTPSEIDSLLDNFRFANGEDIAIWRTNFTYDGNDTMWWVERGESRMSGHPEAKGFYCYLMGEEFCPYIQVNYEDYTRQEAWYNAIDFDNDTSALYVSACPSTGSDQYIGDSCTDTGTYPNFRNMPREYGGDSEDYIGTTTGNTGGVFIYTPMIGAANVKEYFIHTPVNMTVRYVIVPNTTDEIFDHHLMYDPEFNITTSGTNATITHVSTGKQLRVDMTWSNETFNLNAHHDTNNMCFAKKSCSGGNLGTNNYTRILWHSTANSVEFIKSYSWNDGTPGTPTFIDSTDEGISKSGVRVIFDTNSDGWANDTNMGTNGWGLYTYQDQYMAFNTTSIKNGSSDYVTTNDTIAIHVDRGASQYILEINTYDVSGQLDAAKSVNVTVNTSSLSDANDNETISFTASTDQNSDQYVINGTAANRTVYKNGVYLGAQAGGGGEDSVVPAVSDVVLTSSSETNVTTDNLSVTFTANTDNITDWRLNSTSIAVLNMQFELNDSSTAKDYSTQENNGTVYNALYTADGKVGGAMSFDGSGDYIEMTSIDGLPTGAPPITMCAWIKPNVVVGVTPVFIHLGGTSNTNSFLMFMRENGKATWDTWNRQIKTNSLVFSVDTWTHFCGRYTAGNFSTNGTIFIDGEEDTNLTRPGTDDQPDYTGGSARIGYRKDNNGYFNGVMDDVIIFNRSLSPDEIKAIYNAGIANHSVKTIVSEETSVNDVWSVNVCTTNSTHEDCELSNTLTIITAPSKECIYTSFINKGLDLFCKFAGCQFDSMDCYFNATRTGTVEYKS